MNINATIFVQAFNFFVAYILLRILLFKPVYAAIRHDEAVEQALVDGIARSKKKLEQKEREREQQWQECRRYCAESQPRVLGAELFFRDITPMVVYPSISDEQVAQAVQEVVHGIIKKVGRRDSR